jgi:hypothetical protein
MFPFLLPSFNLLSCWWPLLAWPVFHSWAWTKIYFALICEKFWLVCTDFRVETIFSRILTLFLALLLTTCVRDEKLDTTLSFSLFFKKFHQNGYIYMCVCVCVLCVGFRYVFQTRVLSSRCLSFSVVIILPFFHCHSQWFYLFFPSRNPTWQALIPLEQSWGHNWSDRAPA